MKGKCTMIISEKLIRKLIAQAIRESKGGAAEKFIEGERALSGGIKAAIDGVQNPEFQAPLTKAMRWLNTKIPVGDQEALASKIINKTESIASKIPPEAAMAARGAAAFFFVVSAFSALPIAIQKTLDNLNSVEGAIRNMHDAYKRPISLGDFKKSIDSNDTSTQVMKNFGVKTFTEDIIINALAVDNIQSDAPILMKLFKENVVDEAFMTAVYKRTQKIKTLNTDMKKIAGALGLDITQPHDKIVMTALLAMSPDILVSIGIEASDYGLDAIKSNFGIG